MSVRSLLLVWLALVVLTGVEYVAASLSGGGVLPVVVGLMMAGLVLTTFMNLRHAPELGTVFALAAFFWLLVMLGMGSLDPATRHDISVRIQTEP